MFFFEKKNTFLMRAALYWAPPPADPLAHLGESWLGRNAETNAALRQPPIPGIEELTRTARHYGFHCTLRPPMHLAGTEAKFGEAARHIAAASRPFALPPLAVSSIDGFLALTLTQPGAAMHALADLCVRETEPHRRVAPPEEVARRRAPGLSPRQEEMLQAWGYPYVMAEWRFHLTLTRRLSATELDRLLPLATAHFAPALTLPRSVTDICIFTHAENDFRLMQRLPLGGQTPARQEEMFFSEEKNQKTFFLR